MNKIDNSRSALLQINNLAIQYPNTNSILFPDFTISDGQQWLVLGRSGSGKTSLLHSIAGFLRPAKGDIYWRNWCVYNHSSTLIDKQRQGFISIIFQENHFVESLTSLQNLELSRGFAQDKMNDDEMNKMLKLIGIWDEINKFPRYLSIGQRQRLGIARAIVSKPRLLIADEPTSALDDANAEVIIELLKSLSAEKKVALMIVTHDLRLKSRFENHLELS